MRKTIKISENLHTLIEKKRKKNETQEDCIRRLMKFRPLKREKSKLERSLVPKYVRENIKRIKYGKKKK